jgi:hypothetical protein
VASVARRTALNAELRRIFEVVEASHVDGDRYVHEGATVGPLEDVRHTSVVGARTPARCLAHQGSTSLRGWRELERFWNPGAVRRDAWATGMQPRRNRLQGTVLGEGWVTAVAAGTSPSM